MEIIMVHPIKQYLATRHDIRQTPAIGLRAETFMTMEAG